MTGLDRMNLVMLADLMVKLLEKATDRHESAEVERAALLKAAEAAETLALALRKYAEKNGGADGSDAEGPMVVGKHLPIFSDTPGSEKIQSVKQAAAMAAAAVQRIRTGGPKDA